MQKVMKVTLMLIKGQTESEGSIYQKRSWEIPFDSLKDDGPATELEKNMQFAISAVFPDEMSPSIKHMLYGATSPGGTLTYGEHELKVSFEKGFNTHPLPKPLEA